MGQKKCCLIFWGITIGVISLTLFVVLMSLSFEVLNYDEYGIKYHNVSKELSSDVYGEGRHYVQPGESFFRFKSTFIIITFQTGAEGADHTEETSIDCLTSDALPVVIDATVQYQLVKGDIYNLLLAFGPGSEDVIISEAKHAIRLACGNSTAEQMYTNRQGIQTRMLDKVQTTLADLYVEVSFLELINIELPPEYNTAVTEKEAARAQVNVALNQRTQVLINTTTQLLTAVEDAKIKVIKAQADADGLLAAAQAEAAAIENDLSIKAQVYRQVMQTFNFTPDELINYISVEQLVELEDLVVGVKSPASFGLNSRGNATQN
jgi:regulator of protease activity HflC (stomatin/prohibitin superfamily)